MFIGDDKCSLARASYKRRFNIVNAHQDAEQEMGNGRWLNQLNCMLMVSLSAENEFFITRILDGASYV